MGKLRDCWDDCKWPLACIGVIVAAIIVAAYSYARQPSITVEDASLTRFALETSPSTALTPWLTVRNRNWAITMKNTKPLEASYKFDAQQFDRVQVADKGDKHRARNTRVYRLVTNSDDGYVALGNAGVAEYKKENVTGVFEVEVALTGEVQYKKSKLEASCELKLQLESPGTTAVVFHKVKCKLAKQKEE